jgi:ParB-like nuclease domain
MDDVTKPIGKLVPVAALPDVAKLPVHPFADDYPSADPSEFAGLAESIRHQGILQPLTLFDDGGVKLLDGRHRRAAGLEVKHRWRLEDFKMFTGSAAEAEEYVYSVNSLRRHLSKEQKEKTVLKLLARHPQMPSRRLASLCGVSHTTILRLRKPVEDDANFKALIRAWEKANVVDQEKFAQMFKIDLREMVK